MFCKSCGTILAPKSTPYGKWLACPQGHTQPEIVQESEVIRSENNWQGEKISVADDINHLAVHNHVCKRCGYGKAEMLDLGSFYSDEDTVIRMKCGECGVVEQLEGKVK